MEHTLHHYQAWVQILSPNQMHGIGPSFRNGVCTRVQGVGARVDCVGAKVWVYSVEVKVYGKDLFGGARVYGVEARVYGSHCILLSAPVP